MTVGLSDLRRLDGWMNLGFVSRVWISRAVSVLVQILFLELGKESGVISWLPPFDIAFGFLLRTSLFFWLHLGLARFGYRGLKAIQLDWLF